jgi:membrane protein
VSTVSDSGTPVATASQPIVEVAATIDAADTAVAAPASAPPVAQSKWYRLRQDGTALIKYLLDSEVHTFAFSVAANAILSFIPFIVLLYAIAMGVFHSQTMIGVVTDMVNYYLPTVTRHPNWVAGSIEHAAAASTGHGLQAISLVMILISCTGIFLPLEVALNQAWGVTKSRNYLLNQAVAFGLAIWMGVLGMISMVLAAGQRQILAFLFFHKTDGGFFGWLYGAVSSAWLAMCSGAACIVFFFCIYWVLPNRKVPARSVMRVSIITGLIWLLARYIFAAILPHLDLDQLYGGFYVSVGLLMWAYISGLILFAGAQFSVARLGTLKK